MTEADFLAEYARLLHAVQTGVAYTMEKEPTEVAPKHLRTGLNAVMADLGSLTRLLVAKGILTHDEYYDAVLEGLRREVESYERGVSALYGAGQDGPKITLR